VERVITGPVVADTSVWIEHFRRKGDAGTDFRSALSDGRVALCGPVIAELLEGLTEPRRVALERELLRLPWVGLARRDWNIVGHLAAVLRERGTRVGLSDIAIAVAARRASATVLTADRDFLMIADVFGDLQVQLVD
jgi:predicted nucleic acid-binding protein